MSLQRLAACLVVTTISASSMAAEPACRADADCPEGRTCNEGVCEAPRREGRLRRHVAPHERPQNVESFPEVWITGLAVFAASWAATIIVAAAVVDEDKNQAIGHAFVPAAGPVIMGGADYDLGKAEIAMPPLCAAQTVGLIATFLGLTTFRVEPVEGDAETASITPALAPGGAAVYGTF